ncbi:sensor histidine kinase [Actinoplanes derwentensis]|uniref:sensor histidine kinase n=1 Tax=Actinoplanes derwentensis TaxID=113562 RepID=UPI000B89B149|nr:sensor histidine kinase [Actinoplanes derwentensis]
MDAAHGEVQQEHGDGHGLGSAMVRAVADAHAATITGRARPTGGLDHAIHLDLRNPLLGLMLRLTRKRALGTDLDLLKNALTEFYGPTA